MAADALGAFAADPARSVLVVDFDGTLAPIVDDPPAAAPLPEAAPTLARLVACLGRVAVVSGRPVDFLRSWLPVNGLELFGQYGVERFDGTEVTTAPDAAKWAGTVRLAGDAAAAQLPGLYVERKGVVAVGLHWRRQPELETAATALGHRLAGDLGLRLEPGRQTLELRAPVDIDKGSTTAELAAGAAAAMVMGDDRGDVAAFDALTRLVAGGRLVHAVRVAVRSPESPPGLLAAADVIVDGPPGALDLLARLATQLEEAAA